NWLAGMAPADGKSEFDCVEIRFKNTRKEFYRNIYQLDLQVGDAVVVEGKPGKDIGVVSLTGELVRLQMEKKKQNYRSHDMKKVLRKTSQKDIDMWKLARSKEDEALKIAKKQASELGLDMKISDVEYQGDGGKATIYYIAENRVDFRELVKLLADELKVRIEMKQIGARQEAGRIGGIGSCGRELCCSTWLTDFRSVSTKAARYQQLSLNPQKLSGQCGKLKCCLNYELDMYMEALRDFPDTSKKIITQKGNASHVKSDIFKRQVWYVYEEEQAASPICISVHKANEILAMNEKGEKPEELQQFQVSEEKEEDNTDYMNVVGQDDLTRFDKKKKKKGKKNKKK
ncbi:MAG: stage 0 sporulation family protein, partial [Flavobacteriales bacterium]